MKHSIKYKKGFMLVTLFLTVMISGFIITKLAIKGQANREYDNISKMSERVLTIVSYGIQDSITGYMNGSGGDCSDAHTATGISAIRIKKCSGLNDASYPVVSLGDEKDGENSYFQLHTSDCKLKIKEIDSISYEIFLDCDFSKYDTEKNKKLSFLSEDSVITTLANYQDTSLVSWFQNAIDFTDTSSGTKDDGKIKIIMRK